MYSMARFALVVLATATLATLTSARPIVRNIRSASEFDRLMKKHATQTGLPVIVDFYSDGCGPCRMIAPIYKKLAKEMEGKAVFVKVDTNAVHELSNRYGVRSLPTFKFFVGGKKVNEFSGAGEGQLRQFANNAVGQASSENVLLTLESLVQYYAEQDATKSEEDVAAVYKKCVDQIKGDNPDKLCVGALAGKLVRSLKKKYGDKPATEPRFLPQEPTESEGDEGGSGAKQQQQQQQQARGKSSAPNLHLATKEQLMAEIDKRLEAEEEAKLDEEEDDDAEFAHSWEPSDFPERVTIIGGGPAGLSAAIYAARAGLRPVVIAPPMGGQLQGKGVDVENYPGLSDVTGPAVVSLMRNQAAAFGTTFEAATVTGIDASRRPLTVTTDGNATISTHTVIVATGAESNWLDVPGEYALRGGGVSSCATCDGHMYRGRHVLVVGGGDTAMEDALVLARTSESVTVIHRRDTFRASKIMTQRVLEHPSINVRWNSVVREILGKDTDAEDATNDDSEDVDLDAQMPQVVSGAIVEDVNTGERTTLEAGAVFVAIGHTPSTSFLADLVDFDPDHAKYVLTTGSSTRASIPGVFACGDVTDAVYRQAVTSAGSGAAAALDAERWLSEEGLGNEEAEFEAELLAELMGEDDGSASAGFNAYEEAGGKMTGMKESMAAEL